jgi:hypothetical protein
VDEGHKCTYKYKADIMGMAKKIPAFLGFSSFKIGLLDSDVLLPMNEFIRLYRQMVSEYASKYVIPNQNTNFTFGIPKIRLLVSMTDNSNVKQRQIVKNSISSLVDSEQ